MDHPSRRVTLLPLLVPSNGASVSARIQVALERAIALGLFPGGRLPSERQLATTLDVSRTALRSALELVRNSGYAEQSLVGRSGGVPTSQANRMAPDEIAAQADVAAAEIGDLIRVRRVLEVSFARAAARERSPQRIARLIDTQHRLADAPTQLAHRMTDGEFHHELASVVESDELLGCVLRARADLMRWRDRFPMEDTVGHSVTEHWAIIDAIEAGDPDRAERAMQAHLDSSESLFRLFLHRYTEEPEALLAEGEAAIARSFLTVHELDPHPREHLTTRRLHRSPS